MLDFQFPNSLPFATSTPLVPPTPLLPQRPTELPVANSWLAPSLDIPLAATSTELLPTRSMGQSQIYAANSFTKQSLGDSLIKSPITAAVPDPTEFIRRDGDRLINGAGEPFTFQGIAFGNEVWNDGEDADPFEFDHSAIDFQRVKAMGMNSVRFYLNYRWFESDSRPYQYKESGWRWLDQNIQWAKQNGISLILNMHVPQGGYQSGGNGDALWTDSNNQKRLAALWQAIANRYQNETTVAGYGLVNEPIPIGSKQPWQRLAQRLANSIRKVDQNHLLFVEGVIGIENPENVNFTGSASQKMIRINDPKVVYEFHHYGPFEFTHQQFAWAYNGDGGKYPDYNRIENASDFSWYTGTFNNPKLSAGNSPWRFFAGEKYTVSDPSIKLALPALVAENIGINGQVAFDDIKIREFDPSGKLTRTFGQFNTNQAQGWSFWSQNGVGQQGITTAGRNDDAALTISGTTGDANLGNFEQQLITKQGYSYQIIGWMKGTNISTEATAQVRLDFLAGAKPILVRDKNSLLRELQPYINWGKKHQVPLYLGEFGTGRPTFKNNKGGLAWVNDVMDIALANGLSFNYHAYHEDSFGLYPGSGKIVDATQVNRSLRQLFISKLKGG